MIRQCLRNDRPGDLRAFRWTASSIAIFYDRRGLDRNRLSIFLVRRNHRTSQLGPADEQTGTALGDQPLRLLGTIERDQEEVLDDLFRQCAQEENVSPG